MKKLILTLLILALTTPLYAQDLNIYERLMIKSILPAQGNVIEVTLINDIKDKVDLTQEEFKEYEIKAVPNGLEWNDQDYAIDVEFTDLELGEIRKALKKLDREKKIPADKRFISMYDKLK